MVKNPPAKVGDVSSDMRDQSLDGKEPPEEFMATHSSAHAWRIPWTEKPGGLQSIVSQRVGSDLA